MSRQGPPAGPPPGPPAGTPQGTPRGTRAPTIVTRFAPSPSGLLHLGHAHAALFAAARAAEAKGRFLLRIEDIDQGRARPEFEAAILEDLAWLGLEWETPVRRQSEHMGDYRNALAYLESLGLVYPCFCTRKEIRAEIESAGQAPHLASRRWPPAEAAKGADAGADAGPDAGADGPVYPGTCRRLQNVERRRRVEAGQAYALRLDMAAAIRRATAGGDDLAWTDLGQGRVTARPDMFGDVVLARKDTPASYHLAVTWDDHLQGVSLVTRGEDLFQATHVHRLLQALLRLDTPAYRHHGLLADAAGHRLAKRDRAPTLRALRQAGKTPAEVRGMAGF